MALNDMEVVDVASGGMHSIALTIRGQLWSWGCNDEGALGRVGDEDQYYVPGLVEQLEDVDIVKVACGDSISLALSAEGKVYCWGTFRCAQGRLGFAPGIPSRPLAEL
ncbi:Regulator of chromosome condensation, partial [Apophysomyces sp. BC1034]